MKSIFVSIISILFTTIVFAQDSIQDFRINFFTDLFSQSDKKIIYEENFCVPFYASDNISSDEKLSFSISDISTKKIAKELVPEQIYNKLSTSFDVSTKISSIKKSTKYQALIKAMRIDSISKDVEILDNYKLLINTEKIGFENKNIKTLKSNSVLANGKWIKIATNQTGIHKISYANLVQWGINPSEIDPHKIRIFGNGPRMLAENNSVFRYDDITENAIFINGESDGIFNESDYILFYAEGVKYWKFDKTSKTFSHEINLYSDYSYYFINFDMENGLRIENLESSDETATMHINTFLDFAMHEEDLTNKLESGKMWFGESFESYNNTKSFSFSFPNIVSDSIATLKVGVAGKANGTNSFTITANNTSSTSTIQGTSGYTSDYAKYNTSLTNISNPSSTINVTLKYNSLGQSDATGWLDYIELKAWRNLKYSGTQMLFRNPYAIQENATAEFTLSNASGVNIWDISNPLRPQIVKGSFSGSNYIFNVKIDSLKEFISFNGTGYHTPIYIGEQNNQDLHSLAQTDYIIVSNSKFTEQAKQVGQLHYELDGYSYVVVTPEIIYNEFSSGKQDVSAIRDFVKMFYDRAENESEMPKFLLLFGDASHDYKNRVDNNNNLVPTFESQNSLTPTSSYSSDDFFGLLDSNEGEDCSGNLDIAIGRFPVNTAAQASEMVNKLRTYTSKVKLTSDISNCTSGNCKISNMADWRNNICFICDDGDGNLHFNQTERIAKDLDTTANFLNIDKIYLDAFNQESTTGGERAPEVNDAIDRAMEKGALIINYIGHGGETGWTNERILNLASIQSWSNSCNMPVLITATCEFSRFDDPGQVTAGEQVFLNANGGAIALLTTTRIAFSTYNEALNKSFYKKAFLKENGKFLTLGELVAFSKTDNGSVQYLRNFTLLGDPALTMSIPTNKIITTKINGEDINTFTDSIGALSKITISGYIANDIDEKIDTFNGIIYPTVYDKATLYSTLGTGSGSYSANFYLQKNILYKGKAHVNNGEFSFTFIVPKDIQYNYGNGKISYYAENEVSDASGWYEELIIGGSDSSISDFNGPEIELFLNDESFKNGGITNESPILIARLSDENGINTSGGIGHDITATIDGNTTNSITLNDYYENDIDSYQSGTLYYQLKDLSEGNHTIKLKAWDILNNSSESSLNFIVTSSDNLELTQVMNYPNPFSGSTEFIFEHNHPCCKLNVEISIFNISGQKVKKINKEIDVSGYNIEPIKWDGTSDYGEDLCNGIYIYRVSVKSEDGKFTEKSEKLVILK